MNSNGWHEKKQRLLAVEGAKSGVHRQRRPEKIQGRFK